VGPSFLLATLAEGQFARNAWDVFFRLPITEAEGLDRFPRGEAHLPFNERGS